MQPNMSAAGGVGLFFLSLLAMIAIGGFLVMLIALWRTMKAHESIAQAISDIARHLKRPGTTKHDIDRFTFGE